MPTRVGYHSPATGNYSTTGASKITPAEVYAGVGDGIVILGSAEQASTNSNVTPTLDNGAISWETPVVVNPSGGASVSGAWMWYGTVTSDLAAAVITVPRPFTGTSLFWGFSATVWAGPIEWGNVISGNNGSGSGLPSVAIDTLDNSSVQLTVNDWNAVNGSAREYIDQNASFSETLYYYNASRHTVYGGYWLDVGAAGNKSFGLSVPSGQRWAMAGIEIRDVVEPPATGAILLESGTPLLTESGVPILL